MKSAYPKPSVYIARKSVLATLMTEAEFTELMASGGLTFPTEETDPEVEVGFMVEVPEGACNHADYSGHLSWVPQAEFLYRHQALGTDSEEPEFLQRLRVEKIQLDQRLKDLMAYTKSDGFMNLIYAQRDLLLEQGRIMNRYSVVLDTRISMHSAQLKHKKLAVAANAARQ